MEHRGDDVRRAVPECVDDRLERVPAVERQPAGVTSLRLASTSTLIDKGTNVGIAYTGAAPDLGAFETS
ncbi:hypothetical protein GCM10010109_25360 [Actinoplanes campanulatus]|nr:hypothetical protein GCM10010109_25360 [Actinoplanes campanulatus]GID36754.1 hypothetical protein Aca09nite_32600 [Actinoplanes campanulatus]